MTLRWIKEVHDRSACDRKRLIRDISRIRIVDATSCPRQLRQLRKWNNVVCKHRSHAKAGVNENPSFDPDLKFEVG